MINLLKHLYFKISGKSRHKEPKIEWPACVLIGERTNLCLGARVSFGENVLLYLNDNISIGDDTMIGTNTIIHTSTHDYFNHPMWQERIDRPVKIGNHVWIGLSSMILPGSIIGDFAVIGAGTIVSGRVPNYAIVAGNPARILKYRKPGEFALQNEIPYPGVVRKDGFIDKTIKEKIL